MVESSPRPRYRPESLEIEEKGLMSSPRPKMRPEKSSQKEPTVADQTGLATVEARADFDPALSWNPIARLGFEGFDTDKVTDFQFTPEMIEEARRRNIDLASLSTDILDNAFYFPSRMSKEKAVKSALEEGAGETAYNIRPDDILADPGEANPSTWAHEMTHRGFDRIRESINNHPDGIKIGKEEFIKKYGQRAFDLLTKVSDEKNTEAFDFLEDKVLGTKPQEKHIQERNVSDVKEMQKTLKADPEDRWSYLEQRYEPYIKLMEAAQDILTASGEPKKSPKYEESMFDKLKIKLGFAGGGLADQMNSMLPAADTDTRSTNEYLGKSDDEFNPLKFAKESWESAKERFMDAGITKVDANDPALYNAYLRSVDYLKDTGLAGLELIDAAARVAIGAVGEIVTGDDQTQKRFERDIYSMPDAFAGMVGTKSISQLDDAIESAVGTGIQAAEKAKDVGYAAYQKAPAVVGDIVGQTKAAFSGDKDFSTTSDVGPRPLSAGFTGDNPPTYISKDEPPFDPDGIYKTKEGVVKFREPIAEFTQRLTMSNSFPSKGMTGAEFLRLLEKNSESIPPSSYKEGLVDRNKRYSREELLDVVTKGSAGLPEPIYYSLADLASVPKYEQYQRQSDVGFMGYPVPTDSYFSIPILSRTSGNTFKANSQHFDPSTTAHVRGSFIDPMVGWNVNSTFTEEFKNIVGKDKPYLLVEEIQSDLLQKGYVKPKDSFEAAFDKTVKRFNTESEFTFDEAYGNITKDIKKTFKELDKLGEVDEPQRLKSTYSPNNHVFSRLKEERLIKKVKDRFWENQGEPGYLTFEELKDYIDKQGTNDQELGGFIIGLERERRLNDWFTFQLIDEKSGKIYDDFVADWDNPTFIKLLDDFSEYMMDFGLDKDSILAKYESDIDDFYDKQKSIFKKSGIDKDIPSEEFFNIYNSYKFNSQTMDPIDDVALPPIRKNKQTVEEALKVLIAKADEKGVDKIVIPPAERIAYARGRGIDPKDKGDRFYRTYVTDLDKALEDLEKNYPVTVHRNVELPYEDLENLITETQGNTLAYEAANDLMQNNLIEVDGISIPQGTDLELLSNAVDNDIQAIPLNNEEEAILRSFANHNGIDLYEAGMSFNAWLEGQRRYIETLPEFDAIRKSLINLIPKEGTIIDISKLREQFQVDKPRQFAEGGAVGNMNQQMSFAFADGGLRDDGVRQDPVSGNEVPSGSLANEVRDDIPAQLSEGEYVVPADVVRYYGVKFFEDLRQEAKTGLQDMEMNGRIGGEPVLESGPEGNEDLTPEELAAIQEMMGMYRGGAVGGFAEGGLQTDQNILTAGQQAQQRQFTGFPLGATIFPRADSGQIESVPVTPTITVQETAESCARKGMSYDPATQTCVAMPVQAPVQTVSDNNDGPPPVPTEPAKPWYESVDWTTTDIADPTAIESIIRQIPGVGQIVSMRNIAGQYAKANILEAAGDPTAAEQIRNNIEKYVGKQDLGTKIAKDAFGRYADGDWMTIQYLNSVGIETPKDLKTEDNGGMKEFIAGLAKDPTKRALIAGSISPERKKLIDQSVATEEAKRIAAAKAAEEARRQANDPAYAYASQVNKPASGDNDSSPIVTTKSIKQTKDILSKAQDKAGTAKNLSRTTAKIKDITSGKNTSGQVGFKSGGLMKKKK